MAIKTRWFKKLWLDSERAQEFLEKESLTPERLIKLMDDFAESLEYKVLMTALEDYREHKLKEVINGLPVTAEHYDRIVAQELAFSNFPVFLRNFVETMKKPQDIEKGIRPDKSLEKYK